MKSPLDLSLQYKIPIWATILIVTSALAVSVSFMFQARGDLRKDLLDTSAGLGHSMAKTLFPAIMHNNVWDAFEIIRAPLAGDHRDNPILPEMIIVLDERQRVIVSTHPKSVPMLTELASLGGVHARVADRLASAPAHGEGLMVLDADGQLVVTVPIAGQEVRLATLVLQYPKDRLELRFRALALRGFGIGLLVLALLIPLSWYWGWRMAGPMVVLARGIDEVAHGELNDVPPDMYNFDDEVGKLFGTYRLMIGVMRDKAALEQEMIRAERLAATGRLAAGIAHEINNPLGGMLIVINNFRRRGGHDDATARTLATIERGLTQIHDTVAAILVDAKITGRNLLPQDIDDIRLLLGGEARKRAVALTVETNLEGPVDLPANPVRQIVINLLLNAINAAEKSGRAACVVEQIDRELTIATENDGRPIPQDVMNHLFEPFIHRNERGYGLGLWVTYQIVSQLGGQISADCHDGRTRFRVMLPTGERHEGADTAVPHRG